MVMMDKPSPIQVGREFVRQYYTLLNKAPELLHRFYSMNSSYVHGGRYLNGEPEKPVIGQTEIHLKIDSLKFHDCRTKIRQVDAHSTIGSGVVVQVTGELSNEGLPLRRFMQTFVLAPQGDNPYKFYVHNDIFRYQDEVFMDNVPNERSDESEDELDVTAQAPNAQVPAFQDKYYSQQQMDNQLSDDKPSAQQELTNGIGIIQGNFLRFVCRLAGSIVGKACFVEYMALEGGIRHFRKTYFKEMPTFFPITALEPTKKEDDESYSPADVEKILIQPETKNKFCFNSIEKYVSQFRSGKLTPIELAENALATLEKLKALNIVVRFDASSVKKMANESTFRYKNKTPISPLDGILVVVKDEYPVKGLEYKSGTTFLGSEREREDCHLVAKLRELGAVILGVANMHELGLGTTGNNVNKGFGRCHNPYNEDHFTGGSSSGSAAAVASGLVSVALGSDGGGSIRIPSSHCGVVGLKPTFGRLSAAGIHKHANTVSHCGPICGNVRDTAIVHALLTGPDPELPLSMNQPQVKLPQFTDDLRGLRIGIDRRFFKDCDADVLEACTNALNHLEQSGAELVTIEIGELNECLIAHRITILSEMTTASIMYFDNHYDELTPPNRLLMQLGHKISAIDYLQANKQRTRMINIMKRIFKSVDAVIFPTVAHTAPKAHPGELEHGASNANQHVKDMRYSTLGNFTGIPGITIPVGYNDIGLPIGFQVMASWWQEDIVFKIAEYVERQVNLQRPQVYHDLLAD